MPGEPQRRAFSAFVVPDPIHLPECLLVRLTNAVGDHVRPPRGDVARVGTDGVPQANAMAGRVGALRSSIARDEAPERRPREGRKSPRSVRLDLPDKTARDRARERMRDVERPPALDRPGAVGSE